MAEHLDVFALIQWKKYMSERKETDMKKIKIFFGSSIDELANVRNEIARFILGLNNRYVDKDIYRSIFL